MPFLTSSPSPTCPLEGGLPLDKRLIPNAIDELARLSPDAVFASIPFSTNVADGFRDITYLDYAYSINRAASWLEKGLGADYQNEKIGYIAPSDLRYVILAVAAVKIGCQVSLDNVTLKSWALMVT